MARLSSQSLILNREEAAKLCGYEGASGAFDRYARKMGFRKVPHRRGHYYRDQIKATLDKEMGLTIIKTVSDADAEAEADRWLEENG